MGFIRQDFTKRIHYCELSTTGLQSVVYMDTTCNAYILEFINTLCISLLYSQSHHKRRIWLYRF